MSSSTQLFEKATAHAADLLDGVRADQLQLPTPCDDWSVQELIDHMNGSMAYLLAALEGEAPAATEGATASDYRQARATVLAGLAGPGAEEGTCTSPLGFEWSIGEATAGTFMDNLIHSWDLARATEQDPTLDPMLVDECIEMFLPGMPEQGRAAGLVGPAVPVSQDAPAQAQLLAAMGRQP